MSEENAVVTEPQQQQQQPSGFKGVSFAEAFSAAVQGKEAKAAQQAEPAKQPEPVKEASKTEPVKDVERKPKFFQQQVVELANTPKEAAAEPAKEAEAAKTVTEDVAEAAPVKQLRDAYNRSKEKIRDLESQLASRGDPLEIENLKKEYEESQKLIQRLRYEESKEYKDKFVQGEQSALKKIRTYAPEKAEALALWASRPPSEERTAALNEITSDLTVLQQVKIANAMEEIDSLRETKAAALERAKENLAAYERTEKARQVQYARKVFSEVAEEAQEILPAFKENPELVKAAERIFMGDVGDHHQVGVAAFKAVAYDHLAPLLAKAQKVIAEKDAELSKLRAATPTLAKEGRGAPVQAAPTFMSAFQQGYGS